LFSVFDGTENIKKNPLPVHMSAPLTTTTTTTTTTTNTTTTTTSTF
jgi:hypothetical protein